MMRISVKGLAIAFAIVWGGAILIAGACNLIWPSYGAAFLELVASIYPGYSAGHGIVSVAIGTVYGLFDGAGCGAVIAWIYNRVA
jgi:hypothetical protein